MNAIKALTGVCPILAVPFDPDGRLDVDSFVAGVNDVSESGASGVMWPGFASEFHKLSEQDRRTLERELFPIARSLTLPVIVAVQDHALRLARDNVAHAFDLGADAVNLLPPHMFGSRASDVLTWLETICGDLDGHQEVVMQFAPVLTGENFPLASLIDFAETHSHVSAVKLEVPSPGPTVRTLDAHAIQATIGLAGLHMIEAYDSGAIGVQPGSGFVRIYVTIDRLYRSGRQDEATALHRSLVPALARWMDSAEHILAADKAVLERRGVIASRTVRLPGRMLDNEDEQWVEWIVRQIESLTS